MGLSDYLGLTGGYDARREVHRLRREVALLREQVDMLARRQDVDLSRVQAPIPVSEGVLALLREGKEIAAIKKHREDTGLGLAEAKSDVDEAARRLL